MIVTRPVSKNEPDILIGFEHSTLIIKDLSHEVVKEIEPEKVWTHDLLESVDYDSLCPFGWDAFLGERWIGGSEV